MHQFRFRAAHFLQSGIFVGAGAVTQRAADDPAEKFLLRFLYAAYEL